MPMEWRKVSGLRGLMEDFGYRYGTALNFSPGKSTQNTSCCWETIPGHPDVWALRLSGFGSCHVLEKAKLLLVYTATTMWHLVCPLI